MKLSEIAATQMQFGNPGAAATGIAVRMLQTLDGQDPEAHIEARWPDGKDRKNVEVRIWALAELGLSKAEVSGDPVLGSDDWQGTVTVTPWPRVGETLSFRLEQSALQPLRRVLSLAGDEIVGKGSEGEAIQRLYTACAEKAY